MPIPKYQELMLPILKIASNGIEHNFRDLIETLAKEFELTEKEKRELLANGQPIFDNRVGWAKTYLKKAGLIEIPKRGIFKITDRGLEVLKNNPKKINNQVLMEYTEFAEFFKPSISEKNKIQDKPCLLDTEKTPEETIEYLVKDLRHQLADDLLERIKQNSPTFFENLVAELLLRMGYGSSKQDILQSTGKSGDEGIDGIIKEDVLGLDKIYIQAKKWQGNVSRPEIQKFAGALQMQNAHKGIFITTSGFSKEALGCISKFNSNIVLIDGEKLAELMITYNLGVQIKHTYEVKKIDEDYFTDDN